MGIKPNIAIIGKAKVRSTNVALMTGYLKERGFRVLRARGGKRGLKRARQAQPDLILLEAMMPELDGFET